MAMLPQNGVQGLMTGILGSAAALAIAFPLALGGSVYDPAAATGAARTGLYATNGAGSESVHVVVGGVDGVNITHDSGTVDINVGGAVTAARIAAGGASTPITARTNQQLQSFGYAGNLSPNSTITGGSLSQILGPKQCQSQIVGGDDNENSPANLCLYQYNITGGTGATHRGAQLYFIGSRATAANVAAGTFAAVQNTDQLGKIFFGGDNGTNNRLWGVDITATANETWSNTTNGASLFINVCAGGGATAVQQAIAVTSTGLQVGSTGLPGNVTLSIGCASTFSPTIQFLINNANKCHFTALNGGGLNFVDDVDSTTPMSYTAGAIGAGFFTFANTLDASSSTVAGHVLSGGLAVAKSIFAGGAVSCGALTATAATSTFTASGSTNCTVVINGATGNNAVLKYEINASNVFQIFAPSTGSLTFNDMVNSTNPIVYTAGALSAGFVTFANTTAAVSSVTGAVVISGGLGVAGSINCGGGVIVTSGANSSMQNGGSRTSYLAAGSAAFYRSGGTITPNAGDMVFQSDIAGTNGFYWAAKAATVNIMSLTGLGALTILGGLTIGSTTLLTSSVALTNNAAAQTATLLNGPTAGNPTKWIPINDNGTTRNIPAW